MKCNRGFMLVNALVLVAALSAAAVLLLGRSEGAQLRQGSAQRAVQLGLYLDAFEALTITLLTADRGSGSADHPGEGWAHASYNVPLDRGAVAGHITDLQGRFNVNWLSNPEDVFAAEGFARLALSLGLSQDRADRIAAFVRPGRPSPASAYAGLDPPQHPVGGPVLTLEQLAIIPGLRRADLDRLRPFLAALPSDSMLNVNTVDTRVLQALFPGLGAAAADAMLRGRARDPYLSVEAFVLALQGAAGPEVVDEIDPEARLAIGSSWFAAEIAARLDGQIRRRFAIFERLSLPGGVRVAYRRDQIEGPT